MTKNFNYVLMTCMLLLYSGCKTRQMLHLEPVSNRANVTQHAEIVFEGKVTDARARKYRLLRDKFHPYEKVRGETLGEVTLAVENRIKGNVGKESITIRHILINSNGLPLLTGTRWLVAFDNRQGRAFINLKAIPLNGTNTDATPIQQ